MSILVLGATGAEASALGSLAGPTCQVDLVDALPDAVAGLHDGGYDAVVVHPDGDIDQVLGRLRDVAGQAALLVLWSPSSPIPLDPCDVGDQSTIDLDGMDRRTLELTLRLAIERHRLTLALEAQRLQAQALAAASAMRDPLTGLATGERLLEDVDRLLADALRFHRPLSVALVQIEGLGDFGLAADSVVIHTAGLVDSCLRASDLLGRLDHAQLLIAMPGTSEDSAGVALRRIRQAIAEQPLRVLDHAHPITLSIGIASLEGLMAVDELVFKADKALGRGVPTPSR